MLFLLAQVKSGLPEYDDVYYGAVRKGRCASSKRGAGQSPMGSETDRVAGCGLRAFVRWQVLLTHTHARTHARARACSFASMLAYSLARSLARHSFPPPARLESFRPRDIFRAMLRGTCKLL